MRYLAFILLLSSCTTTEIQQVDKYDTLLLRVQKSQQAMDSSLVQASKRESQIINSTVAQIIEDKKQIEQLSQEATQAKERVVVQIQTIRDTVFVTEKKNFWGKSKKDTL